MEIRIAHFYPELLNLYGDKGNIAALKKRCEWRNIKAEIINIRNNNEIDFNNIDIAVIGGGSDKDQQLVLESLKDKKNELYDYIEKGGVMLALCGSFPMLCNHFVLNNTQYEGLGIINAESCREEKRLISNVILKTPEYKIAGFENHADRVDIKSNQPFGKILYGYGNNEKDGNEGVVYKNLIATFLHGPLLPKNPELTDELISKALIHKYGDALELEKLDDALEYKAKNYIFERFLKE